MIKHILFPGTAALALLVACTMAHAQSIDTRIGTLELHNGYPSKATVEKLYDAVDLPWTMDAPTFIRCETSATY